MTKTVHIYLAGVVFFAAILLSCNNPAKQTEIQQPSIFLGTWKGTTTRQYLGYPDSFTVILTITSTNYALKRGYVGVGFGGYDHDSSKVIGTWEKNAAGDTISFSSTSGLDSCFRFDCVVDSWHKTSGGSAPFFDDCPKPFSMKIDIRDSIWYARILDFKSYGFDTLTYHLKKQ